MAWRFKASKYKNAAPIAPKKENLVNDLSIGSYKSHGNFIAASGAFVAFNWEQQGSNLAVLPLDAKGRQIKAQVPLIYAHTDFVTDFQFSPFDDGLLATGSQDLSVSIAHYYKSQIFVQKFSFDNNPRHFHEFFNQFFFDNFSREIKVVNSKKV